MADKDSLSVAEILALCRRLDGGADSGGAPAASEEKAPSEQPAAEAAPAVREAGDGQPAAEEVAAQAPPTPAAPSKPASQMSVAEVLAAARAQKAGGGAKPAAESAAPAPAETAPVSAPSAPAKKPGEMSVAEILAAARAQKGGGAPAPVNAAPKPASAPKEKPAAPTAKKEPAKSEAPKKPAGPQTAVTLDTASILAAARKSSKRGPISKEEAAARTAVAEKPARPAKPKLEVPPMPERPAYLHRREPRPALAPETRRSFFASMVGVFFGSSLAVGFTTLTLTNLLWLLGLARFMFPNILTEPPTKFKVGFPDDYAPGQVETKYIPQFGVWIVRHQYEGQQQIYALKAVCTHLGCTPNWLEAEQKFKCPCHGSGFDKEGINFEGPAPRPLERYAIRVADDGQLEVDKSQTFQEELGAWANPASYVPV